MRLVLDFLFGCLIFAIGVAVWLLRREVGRGIAGRDGDDKGDE